MSSKEATLSDLSKRWHIVLRCTICGPLGLLFLCKCLLLICIKGKLVLLLNKTGYVSQETRQKFIDSQNFYFHFHYK